MMGENSYNNIMTLAERTSLFHPDDLVKTMTPATTVMYTSRLERQELVRQEQEAFMWSCMSAAAAEIKRQPMGLSG